MKTSRFIIPLLISFLSFGCSNNKKINDNNNYDSDITDDITDDGEQNEFDSFTIPEEKITIPDQYDDFENDTISQTGHYYLKGDYSSIRITASKGTELFIFLDGVSISSSEGIAFGSSKQIKLHLVLLNNSINSISNDFEDENAFHIKGDVFLSGNGTLNAISKQKNGLKVSKDLYVYEGVTINATGYNHAITARSIISKGATINVVSETKDGLQAECEDEITEFTKEQGFIYLVNTAFTADTYGDGMQADTFIYISGGTYNITTHGEFISYSKSNMEQYGLSTDDFKYVFSDDDYKRVAKDEIRSLSSRYYALVNSVKGIKTGVIEYPGEDGDVEVTTGDYQVYIAHLATITINSTDDCVHANYGKVTIDNSNLDLHTYDDGVHADYNLIVNNVSIDISRSYEGLEGSGVTVNGDKTNIVSISEDDGINAASDYSKDNNIIINDGYLRVFASGDGLDANNDLYLNGGTIIVEGPGRMNGSLDAEQIYFNGGIVLACSTSGMTERMSATQYTFAYQGNTISENTKISIVDTNSNALFSYTLKQSCNQIIFSHPDLAKGQTYYIYSGSTKIASIEMTSTIVKTGINQGGPGGGGRP